MAKKIPDKRPSVVLKVRDPDGKLHTSRGNGDAVHKAMTVGITKGLKLQDVLNANEMKVKKTGNPGQIRMAVGAMLRAVVREGGSVKIGTIRVTSLSQKVDVPVAAAAVRKAAAKKPKKAKAKKARKPKAEAPIAETMSEAAE